MSASATGHKPPSKGAVLSAIKARKSVAFCQTRSTRRRCGALDESRVSEDEDEPQLPLPAHSSGQQAHRNGNTQETAARQRCCQAVSHLKRVCSRPSPSPAARRLSFPRPQVVSLLVQPRRELEEHYAEDSIDDTYEGRACRPGLAGSQCLAPGAATLSQCPCAGRNVVSSSMPVTSASQSGWK